MYYRAYLRKLAWLIGSKKNKLIAKYGQEFIDHQITEWSKMVPVLSSGEHCPHHIRARKPFKR